MTNSTDSIRHINKRDRRYRRYRRDKRDWRDWRDWRYWRDWRDWKNRKDKSIIEDYHKEKVILFLIKLNKRSLVTLARTILAELAKSKKKLGQRSQI